MTVTLEFAHVMPYHVQQVVEPGVVDQFVLNVQEGPLVAAYKACNAAQSIDIDSICFAFYVCSSCSFE